MALENPKQKMMIIGIVVVVLIIIWQVMGLMGGGSSTSEPQIAPAATTQAASNGPMTAAGPAANVRAQQGAVATPPVIQQQSLDNPAILNKKDAVLIATQQDDQKEYLKSVNQLQMLKVQREIAETNQAISAARLATETADKNMRDLLTQPSIPQLPASAYARSLAAPVKQGANVAQDDGQQPAMNTEYVVISVAMQANRWSAVLGNQGKLYTVSVGDTLPLDGSTVKSISKTGVVLEKDGQPRKISLVSTI